jgi:ubiquitin C-terminal hydrolase
VLDRLHEELKFPISESSNNPINMINLINQPTEHKTSVNPLDTNQQPQVEQTNKQKHRSIISDIFEGFLLSNVKCLKCGKESTTRDKFFDLSISIPTKKMLDKISPTQSNSSYYFSFLRAIAIFTGYFPISNTFLSDQFPIEVVGRTDNKSS